MLYRILKIYSRLAMFIFCRRVSVSDPRVLERQGPLLLACNHPNSFLDAIILLTLFRNPVYSLARGDVFKKPFYIKLLAALRIMPVFRTSEGVENLNTNYQTFEHCKEIFKKNGIVLIFSEGRCINEWHLRPLKKGTARLAFSAWREGINVDVLPVGINYSSFRRFGKNVFIGFGDPIRSEEFDLRDSDGKLHQAFNQKLEAQLQPLVFEVNKGDRLKQQELVEKKPSVVERIALFLPAAAGWLAHLPLYLPLKLFTLRKTRNNDHFDSVLIALLVFTYPLYLLMLSFIIVLITTNPSWFLLLLILPFTAWSFVQLKAQLDK